MLLKFLLICTSHHDRMISHLTFEFWEAFCQLIQRIDVLRHVANPEYSYISEVYMELYQLVVEKCKLTTLRVISASESRKKKIYNIETDQEEDYEETEGPLDFKRSTLSIKEYRDLAEKVFESCYFILSLLSGDDGLKTLFSSILPILSGESLANNNIDWNNPDQKTTEYILNCEDIIFSVRCMLKVIDKTQPHPFILEAIKLAVQLPKQEILVREVLNFLNKAVPQISYLPEYTDHIFDYCLSSLSSPNLVSAAARVPI